MLSGQGENNMSAILTAPHARDHFEPEAALSPEEQRKLRGRLERVDYAAFAANVKVIRETLEPASSATFEQLASTTARARAKWVSATLAMAAQSASLTAEQIAELTTLRSAYEELSQAYEAMRRMVERGYLGFRD
jgi:hypothetical protein